MTHLRGAASPSPTRATSSPVALATLVLGVVLGLAVLPGPVAATAGPPATVAASTGLFDDRGQVDGLAPQADAAAVEGCEVDDHRDDALEQRTRIHRAGRVVRVDQHDRARARVVLTILTSAPRRYSRRVAAMHSARAAPLPDHISVSASIGK